MKTTVDISDALLLRAKRHAKKTGQSLRSLVEEGLRHILDRGQAPTNYVMPDQRVGRVGGSNPLENMSWEEIRSENYGDRG